MYMSDVEKRHSRIVMPRTLRMTRPYALVTLALVLTHITDMNAVVYENRYPYNFHNQRVVAPKSLANLRVKFR